MLTNSDTNCNKPKSAYWLSEKLVKRSNWVIKMIHNEHAK